MLIQFVDFHDSFSNNVLGWLHTCFDEIDHVSWEQYIAGSELQTTPVVFGPGPHRPCHYPEVRARLAEVWGKVPFLGVCLGMQFMAVHLGGRLQQHPSPKHGSRIDLDWGEARVKASFLNDCMLPQTVGVYHSLSVSADDPRIKESVLAVDGDGFAMAITMAMAQEVGEISCLGLQFHPESFLSDGSDELLRAWKNSL